MRIERRYTKEGQSAYADIEFRLTASEIRNPDGSVVFKADDVEVPVFWSQVAADVLAQKYFRKAGVPARLKKVEEPTVPSWLWRSVADEGALAELPEKVTFSQAATFPVAGLTALHALAKGGLLLGRRVLVTGATGGVGDFAVQLARLAGAHVTASARRADQSAALRQLGAHEVVVGDDIPATPKHDLVIESVGGRTLGTALGALERGGICVTLGVSASPEVTFDTRAFFATGRTTLYGFYLFTELGTEPASIGLRRLAELVAAGQLAPHVSVERPWTEIAQVAQDLMDRRFPGKAVLMLE